MKNIIFEYYILLEFIRVDLKVLLFFKSILIKLLYVYF